MSTEALSIGCRLSDEATALIRNGIAVSLMPRSA